MSYKTLAEGCYFKTGRDRVVLESLDKISPNLFEDNRNIDNSILSRFSKFRFTIVDSRKGKGRALYYNFDPNEIILLNYLLSDGVPAILKKRLGAYNDLNGQEQVELRNIAETFPTIDYQRFDRLMDYSKNKEATSISLQKNILDSNSSIRNKLIVKKITLSFEEAMRSASKFKIIIEEGEAMKDISKGNGLNIIKYGTYKTIDKTYLMLTRGEFIIPISEAATRVIYAKQSFYGMMKMAEIEFTKNKIKNKDFEGERIDIWNPKGKSKFVFTKKEENSNKKEKVEENEGKAEEVKKCADCSVEINEDVYDYSTKFLKRPLCYDCQKKEKEKNNGKTCSDCGSKIDNIVYNYSTKTYKKPLCRSCQNKQNVS